MSKVKAAHIETLKSAGIKIIESHIHASGGHIVIAVLSIALMVAARNGARIAH